MASRCPRITASAGAGATSAARSGSISPAASTMSAAMSIAAISAPRSARRSGRAVSAEPDSDGAELAEREFRPGGRVLGLGAQPVENVAVDGDQRVDRGGSRHRLRRVALHPDGERDQPRLEVCRQRIVGEREIDGEGGPELIVEIARVDERLTPRFLRLGELADHHGKGAAFQLTGGFGGFLLATIGGNRHGPSSGGPNSNRPADYSAGWLSGV